MHRFLVKTSSPLASTNRFDLEQAIAPAGLVKGSHYGYGRQSLTYKNKHLRNADYFAIVGFCLHSVLLTNYDAGGLVGVPKN